MVRMKLNVLISFLLSSKDIKYVISIFSFILVSISDHFIRCLVFTVMGGIRVIFTVSSLLISEESNQMALWSYCLLISYFVVIIASTFGMLVLLVPQVSKEIMSLESKICTFTKPVRINLKYFLYNIFCLCITLA